MSESKSSSLSEDARRILDSHLKVGREKPVSYLPIRTVERVIGISLQEYQSMIENSGSKCAVFGPDECCINSGAVYAYSDKFLFDILNDNQEVLSKHEWPVSPSGFIKRIASEWLGEESPVMPVIKKAFGER